MDKRVLIVDDDDAVRSTVKRILEKSGFTVIDVDSGENCLRALEDGFSGLVLMDVVMPHMDGWMTVKNIVDSGYTDRVIICMFTGNREPDQEMDYLKEYVMDYIRKPFETEELLALVEEYLSYLKPRQ